MEETGFLREVKQNRTKQETSKDQLCGYIKVNIYYLNNINDILWDFKYKFEIC